MGMCELSAFWPKFDIGTKNTGLDGIMWSTLFSGPCLERGEGITNHPIFVLFLYKKKIATTQPSPDTLSTAVVYLIIGAVVEK